MAKIYKKSDKIRIQIGTGDDAVILTVSPLGQHEKTEVQQMMGKSKGNVAESTKAIAYAMKHAIKAVEGLEDAQGAKYQLTMEGNILTDECVSDLLNMEFSGEVMIICSTLTNGVPKKFINPMTGKDMPEVVILGTDTEKKTQPTV